MGADDIWWRACRWQNVSQLATIFIIFDGAGQRWPPLASLICHSAPTPGPSQPQYQNIWTISRAGKGPSRNLEIHNHIESQTLGRQHKGLKGRAGDFQPGEDTIRDLLCDCKTSNLAKLISSSNHQPPLPHPCAEMAWWPIVAFLAMLLSSSTGSTVRILSTIRYNVHIHKCRHLISIISLIPTVLTSNLQHYVHQQNHQCAYFRMIFFHLCSIIDVNCCCEGVNGNLNTRIVRIQKTLYLNTEK